MSITVKKSPSFSGTGGLRFTGNSSTTLLSAKQSSDISWTPAGISGCILYAGVYQEARAVRAAQPVNNDWNMEAAGTAAYSALRATLAKVAGAHGGAQCLEVTATAETPLAYQALLTVGNRVRSKGWAHGDGVSAPSFGDFSNFFVNGTASTDWQYLSGDWTVANANATWGIVAGAAGSKVYFDDLQLENLSLQSYTPAYTTIPGSVLAQAMATAQPWVSSEIINGRQSMQFANGDSATFSGSKTPWKFMHDGSAFTHIVVWRANTFSGQAILGQTVASLSLGSIGYGLHYNNAVSAFDLYIANGSGSAWALNDRFAGAPGAGVVFVMTLRNDGSGNTTCWKNSTNLTRTRYSGAPSYSSSDPNTAFTVGIGADANLLDQAVYNRCLTDAEVTQIGQYMASQWGITW